MITLETSVPRVEKLSSASFGASIIVLIGGDIFAVSIFKLTDNTHSVHYKH